MSQVATLELRKRYPGATDDAVQSLSLTIPDGELFVLLGPSGCGKSTLLKLLAGLETPSAGHVFLDEDCVDYVEPGERNVAMVFQNYALYPHMTVRENIAFPLRVQKVGKRQAREEVDHAARPLDLQGLMDRRIGQLSGGQRQRVALARAIVRRPRVMLMDEPLSNLDALLRVQMREELIRLQRDIESTTVYVTHDQVEAMTMGDRIGVMNMGRLVQVGAPLDVYKRPADRFVAGFLGSPPMNFISGVYRVGSQRAYLETPELKLGLGDFNRWPVSPGDSVTLGIRPESIVVETESTERSPAWVIEIVEQLGAEQIVGVRHHDLNLRVRLLTDSQQFEVGDSVHLGLPEDKLHLFAASGERLGDQETSGRPVAVEAPRY